MRIRPFEILPKVEDHVDLIRKLVAEGFFNEPRWPALVREAFRQRGMPMDPSTMRHRLHKAQSLGIVVDVGNSSCSEWIAAELAPAEVDRRNAEFGRLSGITALHETALRRGKLLERCAQALAQLGVTDDGQHSHSQLLLDVRRECR